MKKNHSNVFSVSSEEMKTWQPALEHFLGAEIASAISPERQKLIVSLAAKSHKDLSDFMSANESVGFVALTGNNSGMAPNVANPTAGGHNGLVAEPGASGSADPQYLLGLSLALAAKTIGLDLVQHVPATSQNVTIDFLEVLYNGGDVDNAENNKVFVVTVAFSGDMPELEKNKTYGFRYNDTIVTAKYRQPAREVAKGLIFELVEKFEATIDGSGALTSIVYLPTDALGTYLADSELYSVADDLSAITKIQAGGVDVVIGTVDNTKAVENYVPHQTTKGLRRTLGRKEADQGTERSMTIDLRNENYIIGNRVFTGHIGRLQYKRLEEQGKSPFTFLSNAMLNEFSQEINYQIIAAARAFGVTNALKFQSRGTSFNMFYGPTNVASKAFDSIRYADELIDKNGNTVTGQFNAVSNLRTVMQYETIESLGTAICMLIKQAAYAIGTDSRYGDGDAVVVSSNIAGYIAASSMFTALSDKTGVTMDSKTGAKLSGTVGDVKVYVDVLIPESCGIVTVLRTNKEVAVDISGFETDNIVIPGLAYLVKDIVSSVEVIPEQTGGRKIIMDSETDVVAVGDNPEAAYLTFAIDVQIPGLSMVSA